MLVASCHSAEEKNNQIFKVGKEKPINPKLLILNVRKEVKSLFVNDNIINVLSYHSCA